MRLLQITDFYYPYLGGVEQHVRGLSRQLAARGHSVAVVTLRPEGLPAFEHDGAVRVYRVRSTTQRATWLFSHPERPWAPPFPDPELVLALQRILKKEQPHIVHGHDWFARSFLPLKPFHHAKFVLSLHYYTLSCAKKSLMWRAQPCDGPRPTKCLACSSQHYGTAKGVLTALSQWGFAAAERAAVDIFLPVSQATAIGNRLQAGNDPFTVIPNFVADNHFEGDGDVASYLAQLPQEGYLLFVGDLRRDKGIETLLDAYQALPQAPPLVLVGKVWQGSPSTFPPNVIVLEKWPNRAVLAAWRRSLLALVPSLWPEPFGIVAIEAMASGRPVVASDIGGLSDLVVDGETGYLVPPGDAQALCRAMQHLLDNAPLREQMGNAARQRAQQFYASAIIPRIEQVYLDLLNG
jgi:glycosyltransferase involved in cell wall biosynthesis